MTSPIRRTLPILGLGIAMFIANGCRPMANHPITLTASVTSPETASIWCDGTDLRLILEDTARHFQLKLDLPPEVSSHSSIHLRDVTWREIFKVTLSPVGYDFYDRAGVIVVRPAAEIAALPPITEHTRLRYQTPAAITAYLHRLDPALATTITATSDGLTFQAHPQRVERLRAEIARIDDPDVSLNKYTRPVFFPATLPELNLPDNSATPPRAASNRDALDTQVFIIESIDAFLIRPYLERELADAAGSRVLPDIRINALIVTAPASLLPRLEAIVRYLDDPRLYEPLAAPPVAQTGPAD